MTTFWMALAMTIAGLLMLVGYAGGRHRTEGSNPLGLFAVFAGVGFIWILCEVFFAAFNGGF